VVRVRHSVRDQTDSRILLGHGTGLVGSPEFCNSRVFGGVRRRHARRSRDRHDPVPVLRQRRGLQATIARHLARNLTGTGRRFAGVRGVLRSVSQAQTRRVHSPDVRRRRVLCHAIAAVRQ